MNENIENALIETIKKYNKHQAVVAIEQLFEANDTMYFTSRNGARQCIEKNIAQSKKELLYEYINIVGIRKLAEIMVDDIIEKKANKINEVRTNQYISRPRVSSLDDAVVETLAAYDRKQAIDAVEHLLKHNETKIITRTNGAREYVHLNKNTSQFRTDIIMRYRDIIGINKIASTIVDEIYRKNQAKESDVQNGEVHNVHENQENISRFGKLPFKGFNIKYTEVVQVGNVQIAQNIGKMRANQEDAAIVIEHIHNKKFKMMVVADGVGGSAQGEFASNYLVTRIKEWFNSLPEKYYRNFDTKHLSRLLDNELRMISNEIKQQSFDASTTFVGAIVGKEKTMIANVGDSRAYWINKKGNIEQLTNDDSLVWSRAMNEVVDIDDLRFNKNANFILNNVGQGYEGLSYLDIDNKDYQYLILCSDGVSDCLTRSQIKDAILRANRNDVAKALVESAINTDSDLVSYLQGNPFYNSKIKGGKDNTTAIVFENNHEDDYQL